MIKLHPDEIASSTGATQNQASAINALSNGNSANEAFNSVANNVTELLQSSNSADVKKALEALDALSPETAPVVHQSQTNMVSQIFNAVSSRLTSGLNTPTANTGVSSGDGMLEGSAVWAKGIYSKAKLEDDTTHSRPGFTSKSTGVALGIEINAAFDLLIGIIFGKVEKNDTQNKKNRKKRNVFLQEAFFIVFHFWFLLNR